jgi:hypothetical protein
MNYPARRACVHPLCGRAFVSSDVCENELYQRIHPLPIRNLCSIMIKEASKEFVGTSLLWMKVCIFPDGKAPVVT